MPTFTIQREGQADSTVQLDGDRIELGSANTCQVFIDDLLISLHQAAFVRTDSGYDVEPLAKTPQIKLNGQLVTSRTPLPPSATIEVEGYTVRVEFEGGAAVAMQSAAASAQPAAQAAPPPPRPAPPRPTPPPPRPTPASLSDTGADLPPVPPPLSLDALETPAPVPTPPKPQPAPPRQQTSPPPPPPLQEFDDPSQKTEFFARPVGQLVALQGPLAGKTYPMRAGEMKIGRDQEKNDVVIRTDVKGEVDKSISRRHASVIVEGDSVFVEDQGSVAGTFVNGRQLAPKQKTPLASGDQIEIRSAKESTVFRVEMSGLAAPAPPSPPPTPEPRQPAPVPGPRSAAPPPPPPPRPEPAVSANWKGPQYEQPQPSVEPEEDRPRSRRRRRGAESEGVNPFEQVGGGGGLSDVPIWAWIAIAVVVVAVILVILFFVL